jgi:hypothetical protein
MSAQPAAPGTRVILTEDGASYFVRRAQRLQRFRLLTGQEEFGLELHSYAPDSLQKMIVGGLIRKLEFPVIEISRERSAIMAHVAAIGMGAILRHAGAGFSRLVERSDLVRTWKRSHPRSALGTPGASEAVQRFLHSQEMQHRQLVTLVETRARAAVRQSGSATLDADRLRTLSNAVAERIPDEAWFLILTERETAAAQSLIEALAVDVARHIERATVVDYLALVWIELLAHVQQRGSRDMHGDETAEADRPLPPVYLLTQFSTTSVHRADGAQPRETIHMLAATGNTRFAALKADLDQIAVSTEKHGASQTFEQFYRSAGDGHVDLGLYYASFLEDICYRRNIGFQAFARGERHNAHLNLIITL